MRIVGNILRTLDVPLIVAGMIAVVVMTSWSGDEPPGSREMLLLGAEQGNVSLIQRALAQGVDIESPDEVHLTPLMLASRSGRLDAVRYLLAHGADPNRCIRISGTPLTLANGQKEVIRELLEHGADPNLRAPDGYTALIDAVRSGDGDLEEIHLLLKAGADPNARLLDGSTALSIAMEDGRGEMAEALIEAGAKTQPAEKNLAEAATPIYTIVRHPNDGGR